MQGLSSLSQFLFLIPTLRPSSHARCACLSPCKISRGADSGPHQHARADYTRAIGLWGGGRGEGINPFVLTFRANALARTGKYEPALVDYQAAEKLFLKVGPGLRWLPIRAACRAGEATNSSVRGSAASAQGRACLAFLQTIRGSRASDALAYPLTRADARRRTSSGHSRQPGAGALCGGENQGRHQDDGKYR